MIQARLDFGPWNGRHVLAQRHRRAEARVQKGMHLTRALLAAGASPQRWTLLAFSPQVETCALGLAKKRATSTQELVDSDFILYLDHAGSVLGQFKKLDFSANSPVRVTRTSVFTVINSSKFYLILSSFKEKIAYVSYCLSSKSHSKCHSNTLLM